MIIAVAVMLMVVLMLYPTRTEAAEGAWYENYDYRLDEEAGTIILWKYIGESGDVFVPRSAEIDGRIYRTTFESGFSHHLFAYNSDITRIIFEPGFVFPEDCSALFDFCKGLKTVIFPPDLDTSHVKSMKSMFSDCSALESIDVSMFDTGNVEDFHGMFFFCEKLTELDVGNFDTRNAKDMSYMFSGCSSLDSLDLSGFNTANVEDMECMFSNCFTMGNLNISGFDTAKVTNMKSMFSQCRALKHLDLASFITESVVTMKEMFYSCTGLTELDVSGFNTSNVEDFHGMFGYYPLETLDLSGFDTSNAKRMGYFFSNAGKLKTIDLSGFDMSGVEDCTVMFLGCFSLTEIITPQSMSAAETDFCYQKRFAQRDKNGIYQEPLYSTMNEAPPQTTIYRYENYTVQFHENGGTGTMEDQIIQRGAAIALRRNEFSREGYTFLGWIRGSGNGAVKYEDGEEVTDLTYDGGTIHLYAKWRRNRSFTVSLPAIVYLTEVNKGTGLLGTLSYHLEYTGETNDYVSITADVSDLSDGNGNTIPLLAEISREKWKKNCAGSTWDSTTETSSGNGTITIRSAESIEGKDGGAYSGSIAVTVRSGAD